MELLMKNSERPLTRREIAEYVWQNVDRFDEHRRRLHKFPEKKNRVHHAEEIHPDSQGDRLHLEGRG